jgi:hypothetical protein
VERSAPATRLVPLLRESLVLDAELFEVLFGEAFDGHGCLLLVVVLRGCREVANVQGVVNPGSHDVPPRHFLTAEERDPAREPA